MSGSDLEHIRGAFLEFNKRSEVALGISYEMRDGRIGHVRMYVGHERALDAASSGG